MASIRSMPWRSSQIRNPRPNSAAVYSFSLLRKRSTTAASKSAIKAVERASTSTSTSMAETTENCCICLEELESFGKKVARLPCSHEYHNDCIVRWLKTSHLCPICRHPLSTVDGGDDDGDDKEEDDDVDHMDIDDVDHMDID